MAPACHELRHLGYQTFTRHADVDMSGFFADFPLDAQPSNCRSLAIGVDDGGAIGSS
jgi:hypothetical protein